MTVPIHQLHNVLRTYEKAFKPALPTPPAVQPATASHANDQISISQEALSKRGDVT